MKLQEVSFPQPHMQTSTAQKNKELHLFLKKRPLSKLLHIQHLLSWVELADMLTAQTYIIKVSLSLDGNGKPATHEQPVYTTTLKIEKAQENQVCMTKTEYIQNF